MKVKICGLCRPGDAALAAAAGADCLGVVLAPGGPRSQTPARAARILDAGTDAGDGDGVASPAPRRVGVFVDAAADDILAAAEEARLDIVQLHGAEPEDTLLELRDAGLVVWKAIRVRDRAAFVAGLDMYGELADAILLDGWAPHAAGGAGARFDWEGIAGVRHLVPGDVELWIAGGLTPANVADAVRILAPDGVDVSSGVEASRGVKSAELVREFIRAAKAAGGAP